MKGKGFFICILVTLVIAGHSQEVTTSEPLGVTEIAPKDANNVTMTTVNNDLTTMTPDAVATRDTPSSTNMAVSQSEVEKESNQRQDIAVVNVTTPTPDVGHPSSLSGNSSTGEPVATPVASSTDTPLATNATENTVAPITADPFMTNQLQNGSQAGNGTNETLNTTSTISPILVTEDKADKDEDYDGPQYNITALPPNITAHKTSDGHEAKANATKFLISESDIPSNYKQERIYAICKVDAYHKFDIYDWVYWKEQAFRNITAHALQNGTGWNFSETDILFLSGSPKIDDDVVTIEFVANDTTKTIRPFNELHLISRQDLMKSMENPSYLHHFDILLNCSEGIRFTDDKSDMLIVSGQASTVGQALASTARDTVIIILAIILAMALVYFLLRCCISKDGVRDNAHNTSISYHKELGSVKMAKNGHYAAYDLRSASDIMRDERPYHGHNNQCISENWAAPLSEMTEVKLNDEQPEVEKKNYKNNIYIGENNDTKL
ncbi:hypothetical protein HDE_07854 [Halotydeus destructor]|nr:hypothetical protein HDE_07854 [Halotydeus destructor]